MDFKFRPQTGWAVLSAFWTVEFSRSAISCVGRCSHPTRLWILRTTLSWSGLCLARLWSPTWLAIGHRRKMKAGRDLPLGQLKFSCSFLLCSWCVITCPSLPVFPTCCSTLLEFHRAVNSPLWTDLQFTLFQPSVGLFLVVDLVMRC